MVLEVIGNEYAASLLILVAALVVGKLLHVFVARIVARWFEHDGAWFKELEHPIHALIIVAGLSLASKQLSALAQHREVLHDMFFVIFAVLGAAILTRALVGLVNRWLSFTKKYERIPKVVDKVIAVVVYISAIVVVLDYFSIEITPLVATLGLGGLAVGLALQNTLSNFFAGLHIVSDRPVAVGHFIELDGGVAGYVEDIGWRSTRIRMLTNNVIIVPNGKLAESIITNDSMPQNEMSFWVDCGVAYTSNLDKVEKVTLKVARQIQKKVDGAVPDFEPLIRFKEFGESNVNFIVVLRVKRYVDKFLVRHEFVKALKKAYDKEKIEISWPVRKIVQAKRKK